MKKFLSILLTMAMIFSLVACGGNNTNSGSSTNSGSTSNSSADSGSANDAEPIRVGVVGTMTGENSLFGDVLAKTIKLLVEQKNAEGGVLGRPIEIYEYDTRDDAVETTNAARKAILNDKVVAFIGTDASATTISLIEVATEYGVPVISGISTNNKIIEADDGSVREYSFRAGMTDVQTGQVLGEYCVKKMGYKNIAIIYEIGSDLSVGLAEKFTASAEANGGKIVCSEAYNTGDVDYRATLTRIKNAGDFDALFIAAGYHKQIGLIAKQARDLGIEQPFVTSHGAGSDNLFAIAGDSVEGMIFNLAVDVKSPNVKTLLADFIEMWGYDPSINVGPDCYMASDCLTMLIEGIKAANSTDPEAIRDALENMTEFEGLTCTVRLNPETHACFRDMPIMQVKNGAFETIDIFTPTVS